MCSSLVLTSTVRKEQPDTGYVGFQLFLPKSGAGEGNRTLVVSLGSFCSTIELHPHFKGLAAYCTSGLQLVLHSATLPATMTVRRSTRRS